MTHVVRKSENAHCWAYFYRFTLIYIVVMVTIAVALLLRG